MNHIIEQMNLIKQSLSLFIFTSIDLIKLKKKSDNFISSDIKFLQDTGNVINKFISQSKRIKDTNKFIFNPKIIISNDRIFINNFHIYKDEVIKSSIEIILNELNKKFNVNYIDINGTLIKFFMENYEDCFRNDILYYLNSDSDDINDIYIKIMKINNIINVNRDIIKQGLIKSLTKILYRKPLNELDFQNLSMIMVEDKLKNIKDNINSQKYWNWVWNKQKEILLNNNKDLFKIKIVYINGDGLIYLE